METVGNSVDKGLKARIERESEAVFSSARLWDDGVIVPSQTRRVVAAGLRAATSGGQEVRDTRFGVFRM
jgi:3-methylcrotonyl-CoA carboxylase beta subunit